MTCQKLRSSTVFEELCSFSIEIKFSIDPYSVFLEFSSFCSFVRSAHFLFFVATFIVLVHPYHIVIISVFIPDKYNRRKISFDPISKTDFSTTYTNKYRYTKFPFTLFWSKLTNNSDMVVNNSVSTKTSKLVTKKCNDGNMRVDWVDEAKKIWETIRNWLIIRYEKGNWWKRWKNFIK